MNRIYRLVFNSALRQLQVASELASGARSCGGSGGRSLVVRLTPLALALAWAGGAQAQVLPSNPVVVQGTVSIANTPNTLQVTQTGNRALINWSNFSIGQSDAVNFITNNPSAVTLNVVIGNLASQIDGVLNSDGHVFLINPNGITFGGNAHVNVAGLLATTLSLQDPDVPIYDFRRGAHPGAAVLNHGQINANGGPVLLAGAAVGNYGTIQGGHIGLVAADRMVASYDPAAGMSYYIVDAVDDAPLGPGPVLVNTGTLQASQVSLLARVPTGSSAIALNMGGVIVADTLVANAGGGALAVGANIEATQTSLISDGSLQQTGGTIDTSTLALQTGGGASLNASGNTISFIEGSVGTSLVLGNNRALSQLGALSVGGDATFNNGPHAITLSNANNTFSGGVRLEGGTTTIASNGVLKLRAAEVQSLTASAIGIELNGFFNSTSDQAYNGDVTLTGNASLSSSAGNIAFNGSVNGGGNLRVDAKDEVRFGGIVGGAARLGSVEVVSGDAILNGSVYTWGMQRYADAVRLGGSVSLSSSLGSDIVFGSTIDGAYNLLVQTDGTTRFGGTVGGSSALATLRQDGGTFELGANVNTIGLQTYEKVKLVGDVNAASLGGGDIRFDGAVNGGHALATSTTGQTYFTGSVGGLDALTSLTAGGGGVTLLGGNVTTTGNQHYLDAAVLVGNSTLTSTGSGTIQFSKRLDGNFNLAVNTAGQSIFDGTVGFYTPLLSFSSDLPGSTRIGTQFRSVGGIVFNDMLELSANTVVTSTTGSVRFGNMISGGGWDLRVGGATGTRFDNDVQANMLTVEGNGTTTLAGDVTVADAAQFNRPVLLAGDVAVRGQSVVFGGSIDGGHALDITAAAVSVAGHIGGSTPLASLAVDAGTLALSGTVTTSGALSLASTGNLVQAGAFQAGGPASFQSDGDITLENAGNRFSGKVTLSGEDVSLYASSGLDMDGVQAETLVATAVGRLDLSAAVVNGDATLTGDGLGFAQAHVGGDLVADSTAAITQSGSLQVDGTSTLDAGGDITLRNAGNVFTGAMDIRGEAVAITAGSGLNISALQNGTNKAVELIAGGQLSVAPSINTGNASLRLSSLGGALTLGNALSGGQVSLNGASGLTLAADVNAAQLALSSQGGAIMQTAGSLQVAGITTLYAAGAINLGLIGNSFGGAVAVTGQEVELRTGQSLTLSGVDVDSLTAEAGTGLGVSDAVIASDATLDGGSGALTLHDVHIGGDLTADGVSITQTGTLDVTGAATLTATDALALASVTAGQLTATAGDGATVAGATVTGNASLDAGAGALALSDVDVGGGLTADGASITQTGTLDVTGNASLDAGAGALTFNDTNVGGDLTAIGNTITQTGTLDVTGAATLTATDTLALASVSAGQLTATAGNGLVVDGATVTGSATLDAGAGALALSDVDVGGDLIADGASIIQTGTLDVTGAATLTAADTLALASVTAGQLTATAGNGATLNGATVIGNVTLDAGAGALALSDVDVGGDLIADGASITQTGTLDVTGAATLTAADTLALASVTAGQLTATAGNGATVAGATVTGSAMLDAGAGALTFNDTNVGGDLSANGNTITQTGTLDVAGVATLTATDTLALAGVTAGQLTATAGNGATLNGATVAGNATLDAGAGALALSDVDVGGDLIADGASITQTGTLDVTGEATLAATDTLTLADVTAGQLTATAGNAVTVNGAAVAGNASLDAGTGALTFNDVGVGGDLSAKGNTITQTGTLDVTGAATLTATDTLALAGVTAGQLTATAGNGATVAGATVTGNASLDAGAGALTFNDTNVGGDLSANGNTITQTGTLDVTGAATLTATDTLALAGVTAGQLTATAGNGLVVDDATVTGNATLDAGAGALTFNDTNVGGGLSAKGNTITQAGTLDVTGAATLTATDTLALAGVSAGQLTATAGNAVTVNGATVTGNATLDAGAGTLKFNDVGVGGDLAAKGNTITQTGTLDVTGEATLTAGDTLALASVTAGQLMATAGNGVAVNGATVAGNATLDAGAGVLTINDTNVGGDLAADGNTINQTGTLDVTGAATLTATDTLTLADVTAGQLTATAGNAVTVNGATVAGNATLDAGAGALKFNDTNVGGDMTANGNTITQTGTLDVTGAATLVGAGAVILADVRADVLDVRGNGLDVAAAHIQRDGRLDAGSGALVLGTLRAGGDLSATGAAITQTGALDIGGNSQLHSSGDIVLDQAGNRFGGSVAMQGGDVVIAARGDLQLGGLDVASLRADTDGALRVGDAAVAGDARLAGHGVAIGELVVGGGLDVASSADIGQYGAVQVQGDSRFSGSGRIALDHADNDFRGSVSAHGDGVHLVDANDLRLAALSNGGGSGDIIVQTGGTLSLPDHAINTGNGALNLQAGAGALTVNRALSGGDITLGAAAGLDLAADVTAGGALELRAGAGIQQSGGRVSAASLGGRAGGAVTLSGDNRIASLGDFQGGSIALANGASLTVTGNVQAGSRALLDVRAGDLRVEGTVTADAVRLQSAGTIEQGSAGSIVTGQLSGRSGGATRLGTRTDFAANRIGLLGDFVAGDGFSLTNATTLLLGSLNGSSYSVDAGQGAFFLKVDGGDLLQQGTTPVRAGDAHWWSSGHIGTFRDPIYLVTSQPGTVVDYIGKPPAYFNALLPDGTPVMINGSINLPVVAVGSRAQSGSMRRMAYVDMGALDAEYRAFGIVKPGIRLPADQLAVCDRDDPDADCAQ